MCTVSHPELDGRVARSFHEDVCVTTLLLFLYVLAGKMRPAKGTL